MEVGFLYFIKSVYRLYIKEKEGRKLKSIMKGDFNGTLIATSLLESLFRRKEV